MADSEVRQKFEAIRTEHTAPFCWCGINHNQMFRMPSVTDWAQGYVSCPEYDEAYSAGMRAGEIARSERSDKDYAIEHAEYLAKAAEAFLRVSNERAKAADESEDVEDLMNADELLGDHWRALNSAIYEFRKRALRALPAAPEEKK